MLYSIKEADEVQFSLISCRIALHWSSSQKRNGTEDQSPGPSFQSEWSKKAAEPSGTGSHTLAEWQPQKHMGASTHSPNTPIYTHNKPNISIHQTHTDLCQHFHTHTRIISHRKPIPEIPFCQIHLLLHTPIASQAPYLLIHLRNPQMHRKQTPKTHIHQTNTPNTLTSTQIISQIPTFTHTTERTV